MFAFAHTTPREISREGVMKRASEVLGKISLRIVRRANRAAVSRDRAPNSPVFMRTTAMRKDSRAPGPRDAVFKRAVNAAAYHSACSGYFFEMLFRAQRTKPHVMEQCLLANETTAAYGSREHPTSVRIRFLIAG